MVKRLAYNFLKVGAILIVSDRLQQNYSFIGAMLRGGVMRYSYGTLRDRQTPR
ncbi:MAG: hypothetical protein HC785_06830 [Calothrix sp. CSU_2_0]|nr:hypothetical protein [Calothrix sp. CSU_2_0]